MTSSLFLAGTICELSGTTGTLRRLHFKILLEGAGNDAAADEHAELDALNACSIPEPLSWTQASHDVQVRKQLYYMPGVQPVNAEQCQYAVDLMAAVASASWWLPSFLPPLSTLQ